MEGRRIFFLQSFNLLLRLIYTARRAPDLNNILRSRSLTIDWRWLGTNDGPPPLLQSLVQVFDDLGLGQIFGVP